ncbi:hypothetical protein QJ856_gp0643 [Tupanvirus deep ocean]|uniref:Uncharacterized protein n=2 Tax=Tupanvirus TaxID=2094720 RepID=A0AC62A8W7_9VIRU|nr:hypothetical protein QJ856_gp0643 [Tupanvirus deep ocean]QKU34107.1 hypothetical protein [Tupanvirus deep ocean]
MLLGRDIQDDTFFNFFLIEKYIFYHIKYTVIYILNIISMSNKSKIVIFKGYWTVADVNKYPHALFIYGDNNIKKGKGGQAIIRDLPNTMGIPTKKSPSNHPDSFYNDYEYEDNIRRINNAVNDIIQKSQSYKYVVLPENGLGTGLAQLPKKAPKTYAYLVKLIEQLKQQI